MSNPPPEITTPPAGYEWTGEMRPPKRGEFYARLGTNGWKAVNAQVVGYSALHLPILRKIRPPTVNIEITRECAEWFHKGPSTSGWHIELALACSKALENEE